MKKLLIFIVSFFLFVNSSFALNEDKIINKLEAEFKKLNFEQLDDVNYRLGDLKEKYIDDNMYQELFSKIGKFLEDEMGKKVAYAESDYLGDFNNTNLIVGRAENVFVAKVLKKSGNIKLDMGINNKNFNTFFPMTSYTVKVLYNIKGKKEGKINVVLDGGYNNDGILIIEEGVKPLRENGVYLLAVKGKNNVIISHKNGIHLLNDFRKQNLSISSLKSTLENNTIIKEFRKAYIDEIIPSGKNTYNNLTEKQKESLKTFENGFIEELKKVK